MFCRYSYNMDIVIDWKVNVGYCLYTRRYITIFIGMMRPESPFVVTQLSHVSKHRCRQKERPFQTALLSDYDGVRGLTEQERVQHTRIKHDCPCNCPCYYACLSSSLDSYSILCLYSLSSAVPGHQITDQVNLKRTELTSPLYIEFPVWDSFEVKGDRAVEPLALLCYFHNYHFCFCLPSCWKKISIIYLHPNTN